MKIKSLFLCALVCTLGSVVGRATDPVEKEWAFLIFLNGNNNLVGFADLNLKQLETVGSTADVNVIVQVAKSGDEKTHRLRVEKSTDPSKVTSPILESMPRVDMGDYKKLVEFVRWSHEKFPAKHYFVSFWNHGSGWKRHAPHVRGVSFDDYSGNHITTEQMGIAMKEISQIIGHKVDVVGADACFMAMAEVASEMADFVNYFVASEETIPGLGWPYHTFYEKWAANPKAEGSVITSYLVEEYYKYLSSTGRITLSAMNLNSLPDLWNALRRLSTAFTEAPTKKLMSIKAAAQSTVTFESKDYGDLGDWLRKTGKALRISGVDDSLFSDASNALAKVVVANKVTDKYKGAEGVAVWVPSTKSVFAPLSDRYATLRFSKETRWNDLLKTLIELPVCSAHAEGQWATKTVGFSSQYAENDYSANQVIGQCNVSSYGDDGQAWAPREKVGKTEYVEVEFATPVHATGAVIRETSGSGFVTKIESVDTNGILHLVWEGTDNSQPGMISDFEATWAKTNYLVKGLKVTISTDRSPDEWKEIDSIQLVGMR